RHAALLAVLYTLSLHDALPISLPWWALIGKWWKPPSPRVGRKLCQQNCPRRILHPLRQKLRTIPDEIVITRGAAGRGHHLGQRVDRKSTRLNSSHLGNSYAVFC